MEGEEKSENYSTNGNLSSQEPPAHENELYA